MTRLIVAVRGVQAVVLNRHDQCLARPSRCKVGGNHVECVDEGRACGGKIERARVGNRKIPLDHVRNGANGVPGRVGRTDDEIHPVQAVGRSLEEIVHGADGHGVGVLVFAGPPALAYAGELLEPLGGSACQGAEILVVDGTLRDVLGRCMNKHRSLASGHQWTGNPVVIAEPGGSPDARDDTGWRSADARAAAPFLRPTVVAPRRPRVARWCYSRGRQRTPLTAMSIPTPRGPAYHDA